MGTVRDTDRVVRERIEFDVQRSDGNMDVADEAMPADRESSRGRTENGNARVHGEIFEHGGCLKVEEEVSLRRTARVEEEEEEEERDDRVWEETR